MTAILAAIKRLFAEPEPAPQPRLFFLGTEPGNAMIAELNYLLRKASQQ